MRNLGFNAILMALAYASVESIWPIYLTGFFATSASIGFVVAFLTFLRFCGLAFLFPLFHKYSARSLLFSALAINALAFTLFAFTKNKFFFFTVAIINVFFMGLRTQAFGILIRNNSSLKEINKNESLIYLVANIGWVIGPLIAGLIADKFSVETVLIFASIFLLSSTYSITFSKKLLEQHKGKDFEHINIFRNFKYFFKDKRRTISYILSGGLEIWWAIPFIFIPLEIIKQGLPISYVGFFLFAIGIPLMIVEYNLEHLKKIKYHKLLFTGYGIVAIAGIIAFFIQNIYLLMGIIVLASIGMGFLEPTVESFFFTVVSNSQTQQFYGSFMTAKMTGGIIGRLLLAIILLTLPLQTGILIVAIILVFFAFLGRSTKHLKKTT